MRCSRANGERNVGMERWKRAVGMQTWRHKGMEKSLTQEARCNRANVEGVEIWGLGGMLRA